MPRFSVAMAVAAVPVPAALASVTLYVSVPSSRLDTSMPVTCWVAEVTVPEQPQLPAPIDV